MVVGSMLSGSLRKHAVVSSKIMISGQVYLIYFYMILRYFHIIIKTEFYLILFSKWKHLLLVS